jgi:hypothetical protein
LLDALQKVKAEGWSNVTNSKLVPCDKIIAKSELNIKFRKGASAVDYWDQCFSPRALEVLTELINDNIVPSSQSSNQSKQKIKEQEVEDYISILLELLVNGKVQVSQFFRTRARVTTANRIEKIHHLLPENLDPLFKETNRDWKECIRPAGSASLDETMWPWTGEHHALVFIPRKPHQHGFKVQTIVFRLAYSNRPFAFSFSPELDSKHPGPYDCLGWLHKVVKNIPHIEVTFDSWYTQLNWVEKHSSLPVTGGLRTAGAIGLYEIFTYGLKRNDYRVFKKGDLLVCAYLDEGQMVTITNSYCIIEVGSNEETDSEEKELENNRRMSTAGIEALKSLPKSDLQYLLREIGKSTSIHL